MVKIGGQKKRTQYLSFCRFRQRANVGGQGLLITIINYRLLSNVMITPYTTLLEKL